MVEHQTRRGDFQGSNTAAIPKKRFLVLDLGWKNGKHGGLFHGKPWNTDPT